MDSQILAALLALSAAATWGSGDFTSGLAARRAGAFFTVLISYSFGMLALLFAALATGERLSSAGDLWWGAIAGLLGMAGLGFLLRGFATGRMGIVAPVSAVLATAVPVIFAAFTEGLPRGLQILGFGLALVGIWLLSRPEALGGRPAGLGMALLAGLGFGAFFTTLDQISETSVFWPLVAGRLAAIGLLAAIAVLSRRPVPPLRASLGLLALAGVLDVGGNLFFLLAIQSGRLDVAAVLSSLYPGVTVLLARLVTGEKLARLQGFGVAAAILAIVLITL